jgi:hypothetical protein
MALGKIKADTLEHSTAGSLDTSYVVNGSAKAYFHFNMSTASIQDSLNASSITDSATGTFLMNVSSAMTDSEYATLSASGDNATHNASADTNQPTSSSQYRHNHFENNANADIANVSNSVLGDLA